MTSFKILPFRYLLIGLLALTGIISCADESKTKTPPIIVPIRLDMTGVAVSFQFEVKEHLVYEYILRFNFPETDQTERARVRGIMGGHEYDKFGKAREPGVPTPIKLVITKADQTPETQIYMIQVDPILTSWGADSFNKNIGFCDLPIGRYRLRLENLRQSPEFASIPTKFVVGVDKYKFAFDPKKSDRSKSCPQ
jgi:Domain of unknown function (DUF5625)